ALDALSHADVSLGPEANDLARLVEAAVPVCPGWVISFETPPSEVAPLLAAALGEPPPVRAPLGRQPQPPPSRSCVRLLPWFRTPALAARGGPGWPPQPDLFEPHEVAPRLAALWAGVAPLAAGLGSTPGALRLRAIRCDEGPSGSAS